MDEAGHSGSPTCGIGHLSWGTSIPGATAIIADATPTRYDSNWQAHQPVLGELLAGTILARDLNHVLIPSHSHV